MESTVLTASADVLINSVYTIYMYTVITPEYQAFKNTVYMFASLILVLQ